MAARQRKPFSWALVVACAAASEPPSQPPSSPPPWPPPSLPPNTPFPSVQLCSRLNALSDGANYSSCGLADDRQTGCQPDSLTNCECIVVDGTVNEGAASAVDSMRDHTRTQALVQLSISVLAVVLLLLFLGLHALCPDQLWIFPQNIAFWIYVCDLAVAVQFLNVASFAIQYTSTTVSRWPITSFAACLCEFSYDHPGCACRNGILSAMQQAGLIGSTSFYACLAHNLYRSAADPFTRPSSRRKSYLTFAWSMTVACSFAFVVPREHPSETLHGFGFHPHFLMCWSPLRFGPQLINNYQLFIMSVLPIAGMFVCAIFWHFQAASLLASGGEKQKAIQEPREKQLQQNRIIVIVHSCFALLLAIFFAPNVGQSDDPRSECGNDFDSACDPEPRIRMRSGFSIILCLRGAVDALVGFYINREAAFILLRNTRRRLRAWCSARRLVVEPRAPLSPAAGGGSDRSGEPTSTKAMMHTELLAEVSAPPDISESLRLEVVSFTMYGIQKAAAEAAGLPAPPPPATLRAVGAYYGPEYSGSSESAAAPHSGSEGGSSGSSCGSAHKRGASESAPHQSAPHQYQSAPHQSAPHQSAPHQSAPHEGSDDAPLAPEAYEEVATVHLVEGQSSAQAAPATGNLFARLWQQWSQQREKIILRAHAPRVFAWLRRNIYEEVPCEQFVASMAQDGADGPRLSRALAKFSEAKGGGFFFFSPDHRFMVKTLSRAEHRKLLAILPRLGTHLRRHHSSAITRIHGVYSIQMYGQVKHFSVMENLFHGCPSMNECYDIKGSWIDRHAKTRGSSVRLDADWPPHKTLQVSAASARSLLRHVCLDAHFLRSCGLMDYSLLLGIHHVSEQRLLRESSERGGALTCRGSLSCVQPSPGYTSPRAPEGPLAKSDAADGNAGASASPSASPITSRSLRVQAHELHEGPQSFSAVILEGPGLYRLGIIDLLQEWTLQKRCERWAKIIFLGRFNRLKRDGMSAIEPNQYAFRFCDCIGVKLLGMGADEVHRVWMETMQELDSSARPSPSTTSPLTAEGVSAEGAHGSCDAGSEQTTEMSGTSRSPRTSRSSGTGTGAGAGGVAADGLASRLLPAPPSV